MSNEIGMNIGVTGYFQMETDKRGIVVPWQKNLITEKGLKNLISTSQRGSYSPLSSHNEIQLGTGSSTPKYSDTSLDNKIYSKKVPGNKRAHRSGNSTFYMNYKMKTSKGGAAGNISEIGLANTLGTTTLLTRALIKDESGDPTTITIADDEILTVRYRVQLVFDDLGKTGTVDWGDGTVNYTLRRNFPDEQTFSSNIIFEGKLIKALFVGAQAYTGSPTLGDTSTDVSGGTKQSGVDFDSVSFTTPTFSSGTLSMDAKLVFGTSHMNHSGIKIIKLGRWGSARGHFISKIPCYKLQFSEPLTKDNTMKLHIKLSITIDAT